MITIPLRTGQNAREHHQARARRVRREKEIVAWIIGSKRRPPCPCSVRITRVSPGTRPTDSDNLAGSQKSVRDAIASWLGIDDGDPRVQYVYAQRRGPWAVEIEFGEPLTVEEFNRLEIAR